MATTVKALKSPLIITLTPGKGDGAPFMGAQGVYVSLSPVVKGETGAPISKGNPVHLVTEEGKTLLLVDSFLWGSHHAFPLEGEWKVKEVHYGDLPPVGKKGGKGPSGPSIVSLFQ